MITAVILLAALTLPEITPGAPVDRASFRFSRPLGAVPRGLVSLTLDAHALSQSLALEDLRIIDGSSNQVPYLVVPLQTPLLLRLAIPRASREGKQSIYRLVLPFDRLPNGTELELMTRTPVFERDIVLRRPPDESRGREAEVISRLSWKSTPLLVASLPIGRGHAVEVVVDEADNAPLPIFSAQLRLPDFALRFVSPGTPLTLLYGNPSIGAPRYDLALVSSNLVGQPAQAIRLSDEPIADKPEPHHERRLFGIAIAVAVVVLLITLARLVSAKSS